MIVPKSFYKSVFKKHVISQWNSLYQISHNESLPKNFFLPFMGPSGEVSALGPEGSRLETDSTEDPPCMGPLHAKSYVETKRPPADVGRKFGEWMPAQVPSSSSDRGSKLRGLSQNSPRVASKRDVNITKLN
ncbi:hypothetical protein AVEN_76265-1 [Araneus ventricosus]|uniref:Uncharacterized protein n=1 Tax=Araneus ventricosus TaxID=182803 RepID=A0A4Y2LXJ0_ARAVE|nr:hypothetical protein AVEN_76265-1 [Araneus ventricosus]